MPNHQTPHVKISGDMVITNYTIPRHFSDLKSLETKETCSRLLNWVTASGECLNSGCPLLELLNWFIHHRNQYYYCIFNCSNVRFFSLYFQYLQRNYPLRCSISRKVSNTFISIWKVFFFLFSQTQTSHPSFLIIAFSFLCWNILWKWKNQCCQISSASEERKCNSWHQDLNSAGF